MNKAVFLYKGAEIPIQCQPNIKIGYGCIEFCQKMNININSVSFYDYYNLLNFELTMQQLLSPIFRNTNQIVILVLDINKNNILDKILIKSKEVKCPICKAFLTIYIKDYKIYFLCESGHITNDISFLKDKKDLAKCTYCFQFSIYKCNLCNIYLCEEHYSKHEQIEKIKNYQNKEFLGKITEDIQDINISNYNFNPYNNEMTISYEKDVGNSILKIFGLYFVNNNKNKFKININGLILNLDEYLNFENYYINNFISNQKIIILKLIGIKNITDMSGMFEDTKLTSAIFPQNFDTSLITDMSYMFSGCTSLLNLPDISNWNTVNVTNMSYMFSNCQNLKYLPDISKWNTTNVTDLSHMFSDCISLLKFPDISNWDTGKVNNLSGIFRNCNKITVLPDISKWNTNNVTNMSYMFYNCESLSNLPDISTWNKNNVTNMSYMF